MSGMRYLFCVLALLSVSHGKPWEQPIYYSHNELPKLVLRAKIKYGTRVITSCVFETTPTDDPGTHLYHPGRPTNAVPPTLKFQFIEPPQGRVRYVVGTVERIEYDLKRRTNQVPGVLLLTSCSPLPSIARFP